MSEDQEKQPSGLDPQPPVEMTKEEIIKTRMNHAEKLQMAFMAMAQDALRMVLTDLSETYPGQRPTIGVGPILQSIRSSIDDMQTGFSTQQVDQAAKPLAQAIFQLFVLSAITDVECMKKGAATSARLLAKNIIPVPKSGNDGPWEAECRGEGCDWAGQTYDADCPQCGRETVEFLEDTP